MGNIVSTIAKSVLLAVISSGATILLNEYWMDRTTSRTDQQFAEDEGRPNYHF